MHRCSSTILDRCSLLLVGLLVLLFDHLLCVLGPFEDQCAATTSSEGKQFGCKGSNDDVQCHEGNGYTEVAPKVGPCVLERSFNVSATRYDGAAGR